MVSFSESIEDGCTDVQRIELAFKCSDRPFRSAFCMQQQTDQGHAKQVLDVQAKLNGSGRELRALRNAVYCLRLLVRQRGLERWCWLTVRANRLASITLYNSAPSE